MAAVQKVDRGREKPIAEARYGIIVITFGARSITRDDHHVIAFLHLRDAGRNKFRDGIPIRAERQDNVSFNMRPCFHVGVAHPLLLLDDDVISLRAGVFGRSVLRLAVNNEDLVDPFGLDVWHNGFHAVDFV